MNKKAFLFHLILLFGILPAIGLFGYITATNFAQGDFDKGVWHQEFEAFHNQAQSTLLAQESIFRLSAWDSIQTMAENGGFNSTNLVCGTFKNRNVWNNKDTYCFPEPKSSFYEYFEKSVAEIESQFFRNGSRAIVSAYPNPVGRFKPSKYPTRELITVFPLIDYEYIYEDETFYGITTSKVQFSDVEEKMKYKIEPSFVLNLGYNLEEEYHALAQSSTRLLHACRNTISLKDCLEEKKGTDWHFTNCDSDTYIENNRLVKFCAQSPTDAKVFNFEGELEKIEYLFALDFTPTGPPIINEIFPVYNGITQSYEISFAPSNTAESYILYVGPSIEYSGTVFDLTYFFPSVQHFDFTNIESTCPEQKEAGFAYECNDLVTYVLHSSKLEGTSPYSFSVTSTLNDIESDIYTFVTT